MEQTKILPKVTSRRVFDILVGHLLRGGRVKIGDKLYETEKIDLQRALCSCKMIKEEGTHDPLICGLCTYLDWKTRKEPYRTRLKEVENGKTINDN